MSEVEGLTENAEEHIHHAAHSGPQWASWVALSTVILAVFAALAAFLSGFNETEALINRQLASDQWSYYQAKGIKGSAAETKLAVDELHADLLTLAAALGKPIEKKAEEKAAEKKSAEKPAATEGHEEKKAEEKKAEEKAAETPAEKLARYKKEQEKIADTAKEFEHESSSSLHNHETFSKGVILFQIAIAVSAVSVLTKKRRYWFVSLVFGAGGLLFFVLGLLQQFGGHGGGH